MYLIIMAAPRHSDTVAETGHRRKIEYKNKKIILVLRFPDKSNDAVIGIVEVNPLKTMPVETGLVKSRLTFIKSVQVGNVFLQFLVRLILKQVPVKPIVKIPFIPLSEFGAHNQKLFTGMTVHIAVQHPQVGKFLPHVSRHFIEQGPLAVHYLIVGKRKNKIFAESVYHTEGETVHVVFSMDRFIREKHKSVMHPTHIPLHAETQAPEVGRL